MTKTYLCRECGEIRPEMFYSSKKSLCKACISKANKAMRQAVKPKVEPSIASQVLMNPVVEPLDPRVLRRLETLNSEDMESYGGDDNMSWRHVVDSFMDTVGPRSLEHNSYGPRIDNIIEMMREQSSLIASQKVAIDSLIKTNNALVSKVKELEEKVVDFNRGALGLEQRVVNLEVKVNKDSQDLDNVFNHLGLSGVYSVNVPQL